MSEFPFKVGDKVRREQWDDPTEYLIITAIGNYRFLAIRKAEDEPYECSWDMISYHSGPWVAYTPPPKRYVVEMRQWQPGDRYVTKGYIAPINTPAPGQTVPVIVEELS